MRLLVTSSLCLWGSGASCVRGSTTRATEVVGGRLVLRSARRAAERGCLMQVRTCVPPVHHQRHIRPLRKRGAASRRSGQQLPLVRSAQFGDGRRADSSQHWEHDRAAPSVRKQSAGTTASASPWWLLGSASSDAIDGVRDRSRSQGVAGAAAGGQCCHAIPTARRVPREAAAFGQVGKRRVGAAQP